MDQKMLHTVTSFRINAVDLKGLAAITFGAQQSCGLGLGGQWKNGDSRTADQRLKTNMAGQR